jgi:hypothetical protein
MSTMTEALRNGVDAAQLDRVVLRNTLLLAATTAVNSAVLQLVAAVSSLTYVLFGSVFGAILGPTLFSPFFAGMHAEAHALTVPWLVAAGIPFLALVLVLSVNPDPREIGELIGAQDRVPEPAEAAPLSEIIARPGVGRAMVAALASYSVMVSVMNLTGYVVVEKHHHAQHSVFPIVGAHVAGMYALVLVVGALIDRIGRRPALAGGLVIMGLATVAIQWGASVPLTALLLFGLGVGWNLSFVAATAEFADRTRTEERGKLLGFNDLLGARLAATFALAGGYALEHAGVAALAFGAAAVVISPVAWLARPRTHAQGRSMTCLPSRTTGRRRSRRLICLLLGRTAHARSRRLRATGRAPTEPLSSISASASRPRRSPSQ